MSLSNKTHKIQSTFAEFCKTGKDVNINGVKNNRLHHYRRLFFNVTKDGLESAYPIAFSIIGEEKFTQLAQDFFANHKAQTNLYWQMPFELIEFCKTHKYAAQFEMPYFYELLYFEWLEIEVQNMQDASIPNYTEANDLLNNKLVINGNYSLVHFEYPVHKLKAKQLIENKGNYYLLAYRTLENFEVKFLELSPFVVSIFEQLTSQNTTGIDAIKQTGELFQVKNEEVLLENGIKSLDYLKEKDVILGKTYSI